MPHRFRASAGRSTSVAALLAGSLFLAACGETLEARVTQAMDGCIAARNADFVGGRGATALNTPLPAPVNALADKVRYRAAFQMFEQIAQSAGDQVTLVCALELTSHYRHGDVGTLLHQFTRHPDAAVAINAKTLLAKTQDPLPAWMTRGDAQ